MPVSLDDFLKGNSPTSAPSTRTPSSSSKNSVSLDDFLGSSQSDNSSASSAPPSPPPQSDPSSSPSGGGFFSNLWGGVKNAAGVVAGKFDDFENATGLNHVKGAMQGLVNPDNFKTSAPTTDHSWGSNIMAALDRIKQAGGNVAHSVENGFVHPDQMNQNFTDTTNKLTANQDPFSRFATRLLATSATDPLSYVPIGTIGKVLGNGIKTASDATKLTPIFNSASNALRNAPVIKPAIDITKNTFGKLFQRGYNSSPDTLPTLDSMKGNLSADQYAIHQKMVDMMKSHNLNPDQMAQLPHVIEGRKLSMNVGDLVNPKSVDGTILSQNPVKITDIKDHNGQKWIQTELGHSYFPENQIQHIGNEKISQAAQELKDILNGGFHSEHGKVFGTDAELRNNHMTSAPSMMDLLNGKDSPSIRQGYVENYYPHRYNNTPEEVQAALEQAHGPGKAGFSTNGEFNQKRTFSTLQEALDHGLSPEMNPYVAIGQRLNETSKSLRNDEAIKQLLYSDVVKKTGPAGTESNIKPFEPHVVNVPDPQGGTKGILQKYFMKPEDQSAIKQAVDPARRNSAYDKAINLWKQITLLNPAVHGHNVAYNGMYLGGAKPAYVAEHMGNLMKGASDPWYERALASGAVSSDTLGKSSFSDALSKALNPDNRSAFSKAMGGVGYAAHGSLWDADKALRTSIFRDAVEKGATDSEAAAKANKFLVDYNNTTPFENSVMKRVFPFYSWMKGNLPLQAEQMINNTPKQLFAQNAINGVSQALSGDDSKHDKIDSGNVLSDGSHEMIDPYVPSGEPGKLSEQGLLPFLYGKSNPILKEILSQVLNKAYYPSSSLAPTGKESMADAAITNPEAPGGYNAIKRGVHAANSVLPLNGVVGSAASGLLGGTDSRGALNNLVGLPNKDKPPTTALELITKALGGFSSRDNPAKDAMGAQYDQKNSVLNHIKYEKEAGIPVSKAEKKAAYRKIK